MGISVGVDTVRAVLVRRGTIQWAGHASYDGSEELADVIARLAGEGNGTKKPARVCVVLERQVVQLRSLVPAPPLRSSVLRRWVELEAPRLFRKNGEALVTDARFVRLDRKSVALWAAAAPEPLLEAVLAGCAGAGLAVETIGVASEVLPQSLERSEGPVLISNGGSAEALELTTSGAWRSRLVRKDNAQHTVAWVAPVAALGDEATHFAPAFAAAVGAPRLTLLPAAMHRQRERESRHRLFLLGVLAIAVWLVAVAVHVFRLSSSLHASKSFLEAVTPTLDSVVAAHRDLAAARSAIGTVTAAEERRSRHFALLSAIAAALPDSAYLVSWQVTPERLVRLSGYAPVASRVLPALERVRVLRTARFEGPIAREMVAGVGERDRFTIAAKLEAWP